jgi:hypothetical protein
MAIIAPSSPPASSFELACQKLDICNRTIDDADIADQIRNKLTPGTYSALWVRSIDHKFSTAMSPQDVIRSRMIQFRPKNLETVVNIMRIVFRKTEMDTLNLTRLALGILGSTNPKDQAEVCSAYRQNFTVQLFIAMDGSYNYDIFADQGTTTEVVGYFGKQKKPDDASQGAIANSAGWCVIL